MSSLWDNTSNKVCSLKICSHNLTVFVKGDLVDVRSWKKVISFFRDNILQDCFQGCSVVTCTLGAFISLVWLREQIMHGGGPDWLDFDFGGAAQQVKITRTGLFYNLFNSFCSAFRFFTNEYTKTIG